MRTSESIVCTEGSLGVCFAFACLFVFATLASKADASPAARSPTTASHAAAPAASQCDDDSANVNGNCDSDDNDDADEDSHQSASDSADADSKQPAADSEDDNSKQSASDSKDDDSDPPEVDSDDAPSLVSQFDYYRDSEHYLNLTSSSLASAKFSGIDVWLRRDLLQAKETNGAQAAAVTTFAFNKDFSEIWGIGGGFGTARSLQSNDLVGSLQTHLDISGVSASASVAHDLMLASARAVAANIRQTDFGLSLSDDLSERLSVSAEAHHHVYSDGNESNDASFSPDYTFNLSWSKLALGYHFDYTAFASDFANGYWAPRRSLSNGLTVAWSFDRTEFYGRTELGADYDMVRDSQNLSNGPSGGPGASAAFAFGMRPSRDTVIETYWTGSDSPGWNSMNVGLSLKYLFQP